MMALPSLPLYAAVVATVKLTTRLPETMLVRTLPKRPTISILLICSMVA